MDTIRCDESTMILIHIGDIFFPNYINDCIKQFVVHNPTMQLLIVLEPTFHNKISFMTDNIHIIDTGLFKNDEYITKFLAENKVLNDLKDFRNNFWLFTTLRILYLRAVVDKYNLKHAFHMENDIMIYFDIKENIITFDSLYDGLAVTHISDNLSILGFCYIKSVDVLNDISIFMIENNNKFTNEMFLLSEFSKQNNKVKGLPIIFPDYFNYYNAQSIKSIKRKQSPLNQNNFINGYDKFQSIFDPNAIGQYLGGADKRNKDANVTKYINDRCIYQCNNFDKIIWIRDELERKVPYVVFKGQKYKINCLHIHCKDLAKFAS